MGEYPGSARNLPLGHGRDLMRPQAMLRKYKRSSHRAEDILCVCVCVCVCVLAVGPLGLCATGVDLACVARGFRMV